MATYGVSDRATAMRLVGEGDLFGAIRILGPQLEASDEPEERVVLGTIAYIATDYGLAQAQLERAYRGFQARGLATTGGHRGHRPCSPLRGWPGRPGGGPGLARASFAFARA